MQSWYGQRNAKLRNAKEARAKKCQEIQSYEMQRRAKLGNAKTCKVKKRQEMQL